MALDTFEWRRLCDGGLLEGRAPGARIGRPSAEQAEIASLRRRLAESERRLVTTRTGVGHHGKSQGGPVGPARPGLKMGVRSPGLTSSCWSFQAVEK